MIDIVEGDRIHSISRCGADGDIGYFQLAFQVICHGKGDEVTGAVVEDAIVGDAVSLFGYNIVVSSCFPIGNGGETESAVSEILGFQVHAAGGHVAVGICLSQQEGEFVIQQETACQGLDTGEGIGCFAGFVAVAEYDGVTCYIHDAVGCGQPATLVGHSDVDHIAGLVHGQTLAVGADLQNGVGVRADPAEIQLAVKSDLAVAVVGAVEDGGAVGIQHSEAEFAGFLLAACQFLADKVDGQCGGAGIIYIGKYGGGEVFAAIDGGDFGGGRAVTIVCYGDLHGVGFLGILHAGDLVGGNDLLQCIAVYTHIGLAVGQQEAGFANAIGQLGGGHQGLAFVQTEAEAGLGNQGAAGKVGQLFLHVQHQGGIRSVVCIGEGDLDIPVTCGIFAEFLAGVVRNYLFDFQLTVHIGICHQNAKGVQGGIIGDTADGLSAVDFAYLVVVSAWGGEDLSSQGILEIKAGLAFGGGIGGDGLPAASIPFLQQECEFCTVPLGCVIDLRAHQRHIYRGYPGGGIGVFHGDGMGSAVANGHSAVAGEIAFPVAGGKTVAGGIFCDGGYRAGGQPQNGDLLHVGQDQGEFACVIGGNGGEGVAAVAYGEGGVGGADAGELDTDGEAAVSGQHIVCAQVVNDLLGNGQIACATVGVDKFDPLQLACHDGNGGSGLLGDVFHGGFFFHGVHCAGDHAADVELFSCVQRNGGPAILKGHGGDGGGAVGVGHHDGIGAAVAFIGSVGQKEAESAGGRGGIGCHDLGKGDACAGGHQQLAVVAQGSADHEAVTRVAYVVIVGIHIGQVAVGKRAGGVLGFGGSIAFQVDKDVTCGDVPGAVGILHCVFQGFGSDLTVADLGFQRAAVFHIDLVGPVHSSAGGLFAGIERATIVGVYRRVGQIVVSVVLAGGVEVGIGVGLAVARSAIGFVLVGVEADIAVGIGVGR